ncbi:MAG: S8 family peptidase [Betaproteobacteria bacterium]
MLRTSTRALLLVALFGAVTPIAGAESLARIRIMLNPLTPSDAALSQVQSAAGTALTVTGKTRTGALEITLATPAHGAAATALLQRLRNQRDVLWAEAADAPRAPATSARIQSTGAPESAPPGRKIMLRLAGDPAPDWATLLPRLSALAGQPLAVHRQIGALWVLTLSSEVADSQLAAIAGALETDGAVQYADAVRRVYAKAPPNDTLYAQQWALSDPVGGVNALTAWGLQTGSASMSVAVVDTGITVHPELAGRVLPGYDFVSDSHRANDGGGRDNDASDPGDATSDGECGDGFPGETSSWHGTFVSGVIGANTNNGAGISGMNWKASILPVRVLGRCGGSFDDVTAGLLWAAGLPVTGAPTNSSPARVINMSLGGTSPCSQGLQDAINAVLAQGAVVTVAAGNEAFDAASTSPANCSGVITVGASNRKGDRAGYSNYGQRVDLSAPGGDGQQVDWIVSTWNDGLAGPGNPIYARGIGTSFAAPYVAGAASLMLARNPNLTPGQVKNLLVNTARTFPQGTVCAQAGVCGVGLLDAGLAVQSTASGSASAPPGTVAVIEYYRADKDHYLMTSNPAEIAAFDAKAALPTWPWQRTGQLFYAWATPASAPPGTPLTGVCRFYSPLPLVDSNIFTAVPSECAFVIANWAGYWNLESLAAFYIILPDGAGNCIGGTVPVYRFFNNRNDANMRHTRDLTVRREMLNKLWAPNGFGPNNVAFCSPT